jgi:hypothetical protein
MANDIWKKVNLELVEETEPEHAEAATTKPEFGEWLARWERIRPFIDALASVFWIYALLKVFVFDVDRTLIEWAAPNAGWLVDFRLLLFVALLAIAAIVGRGLSAIFCVAYVLAFPGVVVLWKIPKTLIKTRSWLTFFAVANVAVEVIGSFRYVAVAGAVWLFAAVFILATSLDAALVVASIGLLGVLAASYWRTIRFSAKPTRFLEVQSNVIERTMESDRLSGVMTLSEELQSDEITTFDAEQQKAFTEKLANGVIAYRVLGLWAYELDQYRQSTFALLLNLGGYLWLFLQTVATLALVNYAIYKLEPSAFAYVHPPTLVTFARYVLASFGGGEIAAVQAENDLAGTVSILSTLIGAVFLVGFGITLFFSLRKGRQDEAARQTIDRIHRQEVVLETRLQGDYGVSIEEAEERLNELRYALAGIISYLSSRIPPGYGRR